MWLLDASTFQLTAVTTPKRYAILSHRWEEEEVSFQDIQDMQTAKRKAGFRKLEKTCQQAMKDGIWYVWVDTCCIDKSSSTELQEAINSMFEWYANAEVCYAYLFDIYGTTDRFPWSTSKWFTRGWTLQELIAPTTLQFFDREWSFIGSRFDLQQEINTLTGIAVDVLAYGAASSSSGSRHGKIALSRYSVAQRMSWAANRVTTRPEDRAYSLIGVFGISLPLLYGEGSRAFVRLQEEILRSSIDLSLLLWGPAYLRNMPSPEDASELNNLLASTPDLFSDCTNLIHVADHQVIESAASRNISSVGLQGFLPVMKLKPDQQHDDVDYLLTLGCLDENRPTQLLALRARQVYKRGASSEVDKNSKMEESLYLSIPTRAELNSSTMPYRVVSIDVLEAERYTKMHKVVLLRFNGLDGMQRPSIQGNDNRCIRRVWLRPDFPPESSPWATIKAYPVEAWQLHDRVFDMAACSVHEAVLEKADPPPEAPYGWSFGRHVVVGAIALSRHEPVVSRVVVIFACTIHIRTSARAKISTLGSIHHHVLGTEAVPLTITDDFLRSVCKAFETRTLELHNRLDAKINHKQLRESRLQQVTLYKGTNKYKGAVFAVLSEVRTIAGNDIIILHAFDATSKQVHSAQALRNVFYGSEG